MAGEVGLDQAKFDECLAKQQFKARHRQGHRRRAPSVGVTGTPAFFINGRMISGAQPFEKFKESSTRSWRARRSREVTPPSRHWSRSRAAGRLRRSGCTCAVASACRSCDRWPTTRPSWLPTTPSSTCARRSRTGRCSRSTTSRSWRVCRRRGRRSGTRRWPSGRPATSASRGQARRPGLQLLLQARLATLLPQVVRRLPAVGAAALSAHGGAARRCAGRARRDVRGPGAAQPSGAAPRSVRRLAALPPGTEDAQRGHLPHLRRRHALRLAATARACCSTRRTSIAPRTAPTSRASSSSATSSGRCAVGSATAINRFAIRHVMPATADGEHRRGPRGRREPGLRAALHRAPGDEAPEGAQPVHVLRAQLHARSWRRSSLLLWLALR